MPKNGGHFYHLVLNLSSIFTDLDCGILSHHTVDLRLFATVATNQSSEGGCVDEPPPDRRRRLRRRGGGGPPSEPELGGPVRGAAATGG